MADVRAVPESADSLLKILVDPLTIRGMDDAALVVAFFPKFFQKLGRKYTMMIGAGSFLIGAALQASSPSCVQRHLTGPQSASIVRALACCLKTREGAEKVSICMAAFLIWIP